jgi:hypothetical protein|nr:MAG TPA: cGMP-dependent protein kinase interacting domain protein [Caudoviricetes sp.]DAX16891.1 MAG TPA: cGMP-dependent protein kinase interacting domain protein [Caudoviricetes sp.]
MDYKKLYEEKKNELIELRIKYEQLKKRYESISNELLKYYIKFGKEGKNGKI